MSQIAIKQEITWQEITGAAAPLPDVDAEVLVYDGVLDDTVKAALDYTEDGKAVWIEQTTGDPLPDPQYWAEVPFPSNTQATKTKE